MNHPEKHDASRIEFFEIAGGTQKSMRAQSSSLAPPKLRVDQSSSSSLAAGKEDRREDEGVCVSVAGRATPLSPRRRRLRSLAPTHTRTENPLTATPKTLSACHRGEGENIATDVLYARAEDFQTKI
ncbi:hypothetical protein L596_009313 [Steinernema carpocapsae]|uniref:Uncharacterized protein n=1 Tax=Steinernema carpocapsae TaxID=34508 RepID=A0A4U5PF61_STECR|nr:hypothetical protein L596_009313 [Steinernema carpocapsae]